MGTQILTFSPIHTHGRKTRNLGSFEFRSPRPTTVPPAAGTCQAKRRGRAVGNGQAARPSHHALAVGICIRNGTFRGAGGTRVAVGCPG